MSAKLPGYEDPDDHARQERALTWLTSPRYPDTGAAAQDADIPGQPRHPDTGAGTGASSGREPPTARQRWTRLAVILIVVALFLLIIILHITGTLGPSLNK